MSALQLVLTIIVINIVYVSLFTLRIIFVMKSRRLTASFVSMVEVFTYLMGLNLVLKNIHDPVNLIAYCVGWGSGVFLGSKIEEWLALGWVTVQIVVDSSSSHLARSLRDCGYGVTSWVAEGRDGMRMSMLVLAKRRNEKKLMTLVAELSPSAFVIAHDLKSFRGGFWTKKLR